VDLKRSKDPEIHVLVRPYPTFSQSESGLSPACKCAVSGSSHSFPMSSDVLEAAARPAWQETAEAAPPLPRALAELAELEYRLGDWTAAYASAVEAVRAAQFAGLQRDTMSGLARLALVEAGLGRAAACRAHATQAIELSRRYQSKVDEAVASEAVGFLELGLGRIDAAIHWLEPVEEICNRHPIAWAAAVTWARDLAEARIRRGDRAGAERAVAKLEQRAAEGGSCVLAAALERSRAILAPDDGYEAAFHRALEWAARTRQPFEQARTELCFGERLRRARRRRKARELLLRALGAFEELASEPWAGRARREIEASGARARRRAVDTGNELTPTEWRVAVTVADGATNREAASRLFVTTKTIETHLSHIYRKLGLRSRTELARRVGMGGDLRENPA
jgi:DNA-binding CsgD family transcriptional regulator